MGEQKLLEELGCKVTMAIGDRHYRDIYNNTITKMSSDAVILIHGGGNFGDLYRWNGQQYLKLVSTMNDDKIILFPQTIYYNDLNLTISDSKIPKISFMYKP